MTKLLAFCMIAAATTTLGAGIAAAQPDTCFPPAGGVPWNDGPPQFRDFNAPSVSGLVVDQHYDDPRWRGSAALAYTTASGTANPPVQFRTLWGEDPTATIGGYPSTQFLYMQWLIRVGIDGQAGLAHDVFVGFERPNPTALPDGHKRAFMLRLHVGAPPIGGAPEHVAVRECSAASTAECTAASDYFEVYEAIQNSGATFTCSTLTGSVDQFSIRPPPPPSPPSPQWWDRSFAIERRCVSSTASTCTLWVVSARVPIIDADPAQVQSATRGVERGSRFWYQVSLPAFNTTPGPFPTFVNALVDNWPRPPGAAPNLTSNPLCQGPAGVKTWFKDLDNDNDGTTGAGGLPTGPNPWTTIQLWDGDTASRPATCFGGISLSPDQIGTLPRAMGTPPPSDDTIRTTAPAPSFKGEISAGTRATNLVVAKPTNRTGAAITTKLKARFRLAEWGAQPAASNATWADLRGSGTTGVCAVGAPTPTCNDVTLAPQGTMVGPVPTDNAVIKFDFTLGGDDATFTLAEAEELCQYGLTPPSGSGWTCFDNCDLGMSCNPATQAGCGVRADPTAGPSTNPCRRKLWHHQCMLVELDSDSPADIETASTYRNMDIEAMSETQREATISTGGLPAIPGQPIEQIYLVVMPRNMPASIPGTTGVAFIQGNARTVRDRVLRPYVEAAERLTPDQRERAAAIVRRQPELGGLEPGVFQDRGQLPAGDLPAGVDLMPRGQRAAVEVLDGLSRYDGEGSYGGESYGASGVTRKAIDILDDITATEALSALDIYTFRKVRGTLVPLTSFTLVVHHEGPLFGITWAIDGASKLGSNLFLIEMPNGHRRKIRIRAMAKESAGEGQVPGNQRWPCAGGCCGGQAGYCSEPEVVMGNLVPMGLAGVIAAGLGRRRRKKAKATRDQA